MEKVDWDLYSIIKPYNYVVSLHDYCFICPRIYMFSKKYGVCEKYDEKKCGKCISYLDRIEFCRKVLYKVNKHISSNITMPHIKQNITKVRYEKFVTLLNKSKCVLPVSTKVEEIYKSSGIVAKSIVMHIGNSSADMYKDTFEYDLNPHIIKSFIFREIIRL